MVNHKSNYILVKFDLVLESYSSIGPDNIYNV